MESILVLPSLPLDALDGQGAAGIGDESMDVDIANGREVDQVDIKTYAEDLANELEQYRKKYRRGVGPNAADDFGSAAPKYTVVRHGEQKKNDPIQIFENFWPVVEQNAVLILQTGDIDRKKFTLTYLSNIVTSMIRTGYAARIEQDLSAIIDDSMPYIFENAFSTGPQSPDILERFCNDWKNFKTRVDLLSYVFLLNGYLPSKSNRPLWPMAINSLVQFVKKPPHAVVLESVVDRLITRINAERNGTQTDISSIRNIVNFISNIRIYDTMFEPKFNLTTKNFYGQEGQDKFKTLSLPKYIDYVNQKLEEENKRVASYLNESTQKTLHALTHECLVDQLCERMLIKSRAELFEKKDMEALTKLFVLLAECKNGHANLRMHFMDYVKKEGQKKVLDESKDKELVEWLLVFKKNLDEMIRICFNNDEKFIQALKDAFTYFINTRQKKPAELIAKFMDLKMRTAHKSMNEAEFDELMDRVIVLFRFIQGKDVFEVFYKRDLAKRLLCGKSANVDAEVAMLTKLRNECGDTFTSKLESMFQDIAVSKEMMVGFKSYLEKATIPKPFGEVYVNVLSQCAWPSYDKTECNVPQAFLDYQNCYAEYYIGRNKGRKLTWQYNVSYCVLTAYFDSGKKELEVSMYQALVLTFFNDRDSATVKEILESTGIPWDDMVRTLVSLCAPKTPILIREKQERARILDSEVIRFNSGFESPAYKIKISQVLLKETERDVAKNVEEVDNDRMFAIDARIVCVMKREKRMAHNALIGELSSGLAFDVRPLDIKKRIETLIDREYMKRDSDDPNTYEYI